MRPLVSVIIPAHNPGRYIEPCIRSILRQSLSRDQFEVVFVDDGSTDGTGKRLDRLAREQPHIRVIHIPASGGPGRPRNIGLEAALGEYVQFLDADDELAPTALERLLRMARANDSDIVLGKFASETLARRQDLFTRNRGATTLAETPQLADGSMGPTKLFRAALLRENEITFPEGWRQMEDQLFTLRAYLTARVISILGDQPCYYFNKREDEGHISAELVDPATHVAHLREILDEVDRGVADEGLRRRLTGRFYRAEVLSRLTGTQFVKASGKYQQDLFDSLSSLARERFANSVRGLGAFPRIRSQLLQERHLADLITLAGRAADFAVEARVTDAGWTDGRLVLHFRATLSRGLEARQLTFVERDDALFLDPSVADDLVGPIDVTDELSAIRAQVSLVDRETALEWIVPSSAALSIQPGGDPDDEVRLPALVGFIELDPQRVGPGNRPLDDGAWDVQVRWAGLGMQSTGKLRLPHRARGVDRPAIPPALVGRPARWVVPAAGADGVLRIRIGGAERAPARIDDAARRIVRQGRGITVELPIATDRGGPIATGVLRLTDQAGAIDLPATFDGSLGMLDVAGVANGREIPRGRYALTAHVGGAGAPGLATGTVVVRDDGRFVILGLREVSPFTRLRSRTAWSIHSVRKTVRKRARAAARKLPAWAKRAIRSAYGRLRA